MATELFRNLGTTPGCDPELFVTHEVTERGKTRVAVVGSERILPPDGLKCGDSRASITRDGVQVELHGSSSGCRQFLADRIWNCFNLLEQRLTPLREKDPTLQISMAPLITLTKADMRKLSADARELSCRESLNAYGREHIQRNGNEYMIRTASGHLHLGTGICREMGADPNAVVKVLDVLVGIPCVMVDQGPGVAEAQRTRRETYGRAGEYRLPKHGIEYRVPSNFWLRDYKLLSFVFGIAKVAMVFAEGHTKRQLGYNNKPHLKSLLDAVAKAGGEAEVERVINENDFDGACRIYRTAIRPTMDKFITHQGLGYGMMDDFEYFVETVREKGGLAKCGWFPADDRAVVNHWTVGYDREIGWERFLSEIIQPAREASKFTGIILTQPNGIPAVAEESVVKAPRRNRHTAVTEIRLAA